MHTALAILSCLAGSLLIFTASPHCPRRIPLAPRTLRQSGLVLLVVGAACWAQALHPAAAVFATLSLTMLALGLLPWLALPLRRTDAGR